MTPKYIFLFFATLLMLTIASSYDLYERESYLNEYYAMDDAEDNSTVPTEEDKNCTQAGIMCKNCGEVVRCIEIQPGKFLEVTMKNCDTENKEYCLIDKCSTDLNPECPAGGKKNKFTCSNTGVYPDPYDCRNYHVCVMKEDNAGKNKDEHLAAKCIEENYGYDPATTYCSKKLLKNACPAASPVPICEKVTQNGPIAGTSIFYVCTYDTETKHVLPNLYMCPHGTKYGNKGCA